MTPNDPNSILFGALLLAASVGCSHEQRAHAEAEPNSAHAEVRSDGHGRHAEDAYDGSKVARTGITLHPDIADACKVQNTETFFAFDSTSITDRTGRVLHQVADCVKDGALAGKELELVGHTDPQGTDAYNKELGISRAESVASYLRECGVAPTQIEINSVGEDGASPAMEDWPLDRRVEIRVKAVRSASR